MVLGMLKTEDENSVESLSASVLLVRLRVEPQPESLISFIMLVSASCSQFENKGGFGGFPIEVHRALALGVDQGQG